MMNLFGKLFTLLVFAFSVLFLALSIGVYANHVNWKSKVKDQPGPVDKLETRIKELAYSRDRADARYRDAFDQLGQMEAARDYRQRFYAAKLKMLETGMDEKGNVVNTPVYAVAPNKQGVVDVRMIGAPTEVIEARGEPLRALVYYQQQQAARHMDLLQEQGKIDDLQNKLADLTLTMQGGKRNNQDVVGLIRQKEIQVDARNRAINEQDYLKPFLANRYAETVLLLKRENALKKRLEELERGATSKAD